MSATTTGTRSIACLHGGECAPDEVRAWVINRYYYQSRIPMKDAAFMSRVESPALRRAWRKRIEDHDGTEGREGGIVRWLRLAEAVGLDPDYVASCRGVLPATRFAVDAYVRFVREASLLEAVAASLTELFAPKIHAERIEGLLKHYAFADDRSLAYFRNRLREAREDVAFGLAFVLDRADTAEKQDAAAAALEFKTDVLWAQLDALWGAYPRAGAHPAGRMAPGRGHARGGGMSVPTEAVPALPRGVRVHEDRVRGMTVLLAPERVVKLDAIGAAILAEADGHHAVRHHRRDASPPATARPRRRSRPMRPASSRASPSGACWRSRAMRPNPPMAMLAELTHRCPLSCPYCSNPVELSRKDSELSTDAWIATFREAAALGVLHVHLSGGEPASRPDLVPLVAAARDAGLYTNLITSGIGLTERRVAELDAAGLDHVQLSIQGTDAAMADRVGGYRGGFARKMQVASWVHATGLPLTVNAVMHKQNLDRLEETIELAVTLGARRLEVATVQFHGWAALNRAALMPTRAQAMRAREIVLAARERLRGTLVIDYVPADHHAALPEGLHGRLGLHRPQRHPRRHRAAVPRRPDHPGPRLRARRLPPAQGDLGDRACLHGLPRHRLDAGALPLLRAQDRRFRRLPLPGHGARR
jgi:pyrroloquinoline-quinone synthase